MLLISVPFIGTTVYAWRCHQPLAFCSQLVFWGVLERVLAFMDTALGHGCCRFGNNQSQLTRLGMQNRVPSFGEWIHISHWKCTHYIYSILKTPPSILGLPHLLATEEILTTIHLQPKYYVIEYFVQLGTILDLALLYF